MQENGIEVGVTVGKFNPPHLGHLSLIESGAARVDHLYVLVADRFGETIPAVDRARWLTEAGPGNVTVLTTPDDLPHANEPWAQRALELLPEPPAIAFTSEPWGPEWAALMGARHMAIDPGRDRLPISATQIRRDLRGGFHWLIPPARAGLARRVVLAGAESTGKSTLAAALAERFQTTFVPEYGRWYWEGRRFLRDQTWRSEEFHRIARGHHAIADDLARTAAGGLLVLDTDALVTAVWHRRYLGCDDSDLLRTCAEHRPHHYLICSPDFEWVQDGSRESSRQRQAMHEWTVELVEASGVPYTVLRGAPDERLERAADLVNRLTAFEPLT
ncbi:MAG: AAA family ATPase [Acidimicrobiia bacterium]|nr:AAA family ATPase [Acidimicrobiia bacterium]